MTYAAPADLSAPSVADLRRAAERDACRLHGRALSGRLSLYRAPASGAWSAYADANRRNGNPDRGSRAEPVRRAVAEAALSLGLFVPTATDLPGDAYAPVPTWADLFAGYADGR